MPIGMNGPNLASADQILEKSLNKYFKSHKQGK